MQYHCKYDELKDPEVLTPHPRNYNKHPDRQIELLAKIINHTGYRHSVIVSKMSGFVVAGHGRIDAAKKLGVQVPVQYQDFKNEAEEFEFLVADNKIAELAAPDENLIIEGIKELEIDDFELLGLENFELPHEPEPAQCDEDEVPENVDTRCKPGDVWLLGDHRLLCGDATMVDSVQRLMNGDKADMVFTDPPYGIEEKGDRSNRSGLTKGNKLKDFQDDSIQYAIDAFNLCERLDIPVQYWFGANYYCHHLPQTNNWLVWDKRVEDKQTDMQSDCELAWVKSKHNSVRIFRHLWKGLIKGSEHGQKRVHPTQKPIALAEWCIDKHESKSVLDLFGGSGSTLIACEKTNRKCFMMEIDPHYCDVILSRWERYTGKEAKLET